MRKTAILLLLMMLPCTLFALSFGYGVSVEGWSGFNESSATRLSFMLDLTDSRYVTVEGGAALGFNSGRMVSVFLHVRQSRDLGAEVQRRYNSG